MLTNGLVGSCHKATAEEKRAATLEAACWPLEVVFCSLGRSRPGAHRIGRCVKVCFEHHPRCALGRRWTVLKASSTYFGCQKIRMCINRVRLSHCLSCTCTHFGFHSCTNIGVSGSVRAVSPLRKRPSNTARPRFSTAHPIQLTPVTKRTREQGRSHKLCAFHHRVPP